MPGCNVGRYLWGIEKAENTGEMSQRILNSVISLASAAKKKKYRKKAFRMRQLFLLFNS